MKKSKPATALWFMIMKITGIQIFMTILLTGNAIAATYAQELLNRRINVTTDQISLRDLLDRIGEEAKMEITYNSSLIPTNKFISVNFRNERVGDALTRILDPLNVGYIVLESQLILRRKSLVALPSFKTVEVTAPVIDRSISGTVRDENGQFLPGVSIVVKGSQTGTVTDENGKFMLSVPVGEQMLIFSFIGYASQQVLAGNLSVLEISMKPQVNSLDEMVVVGYGSQSRETVTTSVAKLDNRVLENVPYANAASALQGTVSGVRVQSISGQPGSAPRVIVRGGTSINNPDGAVPLYIIDGVIRQNMNDISTEDIESIQVLKDAASTAIYGARASNGVVIISTKTGKAGKMRITYSYDLTASRVGKKYDMASAREYIYLGRLGIVKAARYTPALMAKLNSPIGYGTGNDLTKNTAFTTQYLTADNKHKLEEGWESMPDPLDSTRTIIFKETDFQDLTYQTALSNNHHVSVSGGTEKANLSAGIGYMTNEGTVITTQYKRLTFNLNGDLKLRDNLLFFGRSMYTSSGNNEVYSLENIFGRSAGTPPTAKYAFEDGSLAPGQSRSIGNPMYHLNNDVNRNSTENLTIAMGAKWNILRGLSFEPQVSLYKISRDANSFVPAYWDGPTNYNASRLVTSSYSKMTQKQADAVFSYDKSFSAHNLGVRAGFSYFSREFYTLSASGQGAATDLIPTLNASSTMVSMDATISNQVILGYFVRLAYDYKQKYLFNVNARFDAASNLGKTHRWGLFPGLSAGWNMHEEEFWKALPDNLLRLKIRASYGASGNISGLSDFQSQGEYTAGERYAGSSAIQNSVIPNPSLKWEQSKTVDLGADLGLYNSRINILFDYYVRTTDNLLTSMSLPPSTGFSSIYTNLGSLRNKGFELEVNANALSPASEVQWNISLSASKTRNKILRLPDNGTPNNRIGGVYTWDTQTGDYAWKGGLQEGGSPGDVYGYKVVGIYRTDEEANAGPINTMIPGADKTGYGGYVKFLDADGNGNIESTDQVYLGNDYPTWNGGISNSVSYKKINLIVRLDYTTGHSIWNYARRFMNNNSQGDVNMTKEMAVYSWKAPGDNARMPQYIYQQTYNQPGYTSENVEKGDFLCIRELTLSYNLPLPLLKRLNLSNVRLNVTGSNLHYFTGYKGLNPEEGGKDNGRYPMPKNLTFGLSVSL